MQSLLSSFDAFIATSRNEEIENFELFAIMKTLMNKNIRKVTVNITSYNFIGRYRPNRGGE